ncbi:putative 2OG-Fe(II) oxygenase family oxidoreductase [Diplogelasinospora grovesii]|uniref:2OG-Fe(II) oxygenase family oxidoreductase n=1 Tax=Diplogelasinospora grovesii TaxID=303347 RepID=A0AAN6N0H3_9PEZI|nr:putative 2OG-Fe(II) oxygenase family oxidoreductase [Diplogelasinospora grovesii]
MPKAWLIRVVIDAVRDACRRTGFFQVRFFALPPDEKKKLDATTTIGRRGYDVLASQSYHVDTLPDLKEGFYVGHDVPLGDPKAQTRRFFMGPNVWPEPEVLGRSDFRDPAEAYFEAVHGLALKMLELIEGTLPYGKGIFREFAAGHTVSVLRMLHYPPAPPPRNSPGGGKKQQLGAGAHIDFGAITVLLQDEHPGLEVLDPETKYKSTCSVHRVINKAPTDRYSAVFFYDGALDCPLTPLNQLVEEREDVLTVEKHTIKRITDSYGPAQKS